MQRRNRFLIGLAAAAITFTSLMVFAGPKRFANYRHQYMNEQRCGESKAQPSETPIKTP